MLPKQSSAPWHMASMIGNVNFYRNYRFSDAQTQQRHSSHIPYATSLLHRRSWSFRPTKIQSFPVNIFSCQGGPSLQSPFCRAKILCQTVLPIGKHAAKLSKMNEKQENMTETNQKWQKTDKNDRKASKMWSFTNYLLPSSDFCPAKLPFLSCQTVNSVLPSSHFCPAKVPIFVLPSLLIFPGGGQGLKAPT